MVLGVDLPVGKSSSRRLVQVTAKDTLIHFSYVYRACTLHAIVPQPVKSEHAYPPREIWQDMALSCHVVNMVQV